MFLGFDFLFGFVLRFIEKFYIFAVLLCKTVLTFIFKMYLIKDLITTKSHTERSTNNLLEVVDSAVFGTYG